MENKLYLVAKAIEEERQIVNNKLTNLKMIEKGLNSDSEAEKEYAKAQLEKMFNEI